MAESATASAPVSCYHCGETVPAGLDLSVRIAGIARPMCCPGCQAVAGMIAGQGLQDFYRNRSAYSQRPQEDSLDSADEFRIYDDPDVAASFAPPQADGSVAAQILLGGITCAACTWLIEHALRQLPGIQFADVNLQQARLDVRFLPGRISLSAIFTRLQALGYTPRPFLAGTRKQQQEQEYHADLRRLGVAGFGMMQVGMFAIALHAGDLQGIEGQYQSLLRTVSLLVSGFVVYYAGGIFFRTAWRHLRAGALVMDLPVALAIGLAWLASAWATVSGGGQVYFDSVVMFTFFLLLGRFLEARARQRFLPDWADVEATLPEAVSALRAGDWATLSRRQLLPGDRVRLKPGQAVPADARVVAGRSAVREESINGEHLPRPVAPGDEVFAGTLNVEGPLEVEVLVDFTHSRLAALQSSTAGAQREKPRLARLADRIAGYFVAGILLLTGATALFWWQVDPQRALWVSLSVLVIACPCALALATPAALAAAAGALRAGGILVRGENALETLPRCSHLLFDKTGTLTQGQLSIAEVAAAGDSNQAQVLAIAAALQQWSNHPVAPAFAELPATLTCERAEQVIGAGMQGDIGGTGYRMGSEAFCREWCPGLPPPPATPLYWVALCSRQRALGWIGLRDALRPEAGKAVAQAQREGLTVALLSGDSSPRAAELARELGMDIAGTGLSAEQKLETLRTLQRAGAVVAMVGDGLNDAPVLGAADVSYAVAGAADYTNAQADFTLAGKLDGLAASRRMAQRCRRVMRQNLLWALGYNLLAIPLAASGQVPPWAAAIGMSASSLLVVLNSLRLYRRAKA
ncbi:heavy metal translocating P-type ATPase [Haliea sp. E17]|uniref:heavy metal translocating P-type ATPase n=1 Tax=Haliea sp. E17 TaxID=3401576 RepID=UPI003AAAA77B